MHLHRNQPGSSSCSSEFGLPKALWLFPKTREIFRKGRSCILVEGRTVLGGTDPLAPAHH